VARALCHLASVAITAIQRRAFLIAAIGVASAEPWHVRLRIGADDQSEC
jgi:hypothetical protein